MADHDGQRVLLPFRYDGGIRLRAWRGGRCLSRVRPESWPRRAWGDGAEPLRGRRPVMALRHAVQAGDGPGGYRGGPGRDGA